MQIGRHGTRINGRHAHSWHGRGGNERLGVDEPMRQCCRLVRHIATDVTAPAKGLQGRAIGATRRSNAGNHVTTTALVLGEQKLAARHLLPVLLRVQLRRLA